jgi:hypothetical protein
LAFWPGGITIGPVPPGQSDQIEPSAFPFPLEGPEGNVRWGFLLKVFDLSRLNFLLLPAASVNEKGGQGQKTKPTKLATNPIFRLLQVRNWISFTRFGPGCSKSCITACFIGDLIFEMLFCALRIFWLASGLNGCLAPQQGFLFFGWVGTGGRIGAWKPGGLAGSPSGQYPRL